MAHKLSETQREILAALNSGAVLWGLSGIHGGFALHSSVNHQTVHPNTAWSLIEHGYVQSAHTKNLPCWRSADYEITEKGRDALTRAS